MLRKWAENPRQEQDCTIDPGTSLFPFSTPLFLNNTHWLIKTIWRMQELIDSANPLFNKFPSLERTERKGKEKSVHRKKNPEVDNNCISSCGKHDLFPFPLFFSSPLHSKEPFWRAECRGWLQPFTLFGPWQRLQVNNPEPAGKWKRLNQLSKHCIRKWPAERSMPKVASCHVLLY